MTVTPLPPGPPVKKSPFYASAEAWIEAEWSDWRSFVALHPYWATGTAFVLGVVVRSIL